MALRVSSPVLVGRAADAVDVYLAGARADFKRILADSPAPLQPQDATPVHGGLAEVAMWEGRLPGARAAVADGLAVLATADEPYWIGGLCRTGMAAEAALAERARARHEGAEELQARRLAAALIDRVRTATAAPEVVVTPGVKANLLAVEAEWSRVDGHSDPERWASSAQVWEALGYPWPAAYARWRQAEALFISDKTASVHVSNILAKLGVANRGEAAAVAHRLRLTI